MVKKAYADFNDRKISEVLSAMHPCVQWSNGWEGGYVTGHNEVADYWTRQWKEIDPYVEPLDFEERENGILEVTVHQIVKDLQGNVIFDGHVKHIYTIDDGLIKKMDIEKN
jgi:hypothetical protein